MPLAHSFVAPLAVLGLALLTTTANAATTVDFGWLVDEVTPFLETTILALMGALLGWLTSRASRWIGIEIDRDQAEALQAAIARGVRQAVSLVQAEAREHANVDIESRLIAETAIYLERLMPDALEHFGITDDNLDRLIRAHLGPDLVHWASNLEPAS